MTWTPPPKPRPAPPPVPLAEQYGIDLSRPLEPMPPEFFYYHWMYHHGLSIADVPQSGAISKADQ